MAPTQIANLRKWLQMAPLFKRRYGKMSQIVKPCWGLCYKTPWVGERFILSLFWHPWVLGLTPSCPRLWVEVPRYIFLTKYFYSKNSVNLRFRTCRQNQSDFFYERWREKVERDSNPGLLKLLSSSVPERYFKLKRELKHISIYLGIE